MAAQFLVVLSLAVAASAGVVPVAKLAYAEPEVPANYQFQYSVQDGHTGDSKQQAEARSGDAVQGSYSLLQPDGVQRIVDYTADAEHGFNAVVRYEGQPIAAAPVAKVAYAAPVAKVAYSAPISYAAPVAKVAYAAPVAKVAYSAPISYAAPVANVAYSSPISYAAPVAKVAYSSPISYAAPAYSAPISYAAPVAKLAYSTPISQVSFTSPAISYHH